MPTQDAPQADLRTKVYLYCFVGCGVSDAYVLQGSLFKAGFIPEGWSVDSSFVNAYTPPTDLADALYIGIFGLTMAINIQYAIRLAEKIRVAAPQVPLVVGGEYPTHAPEHMLDTGLFDMVILGDADATVVELATAIQAGSPTASIPGLVLRNADGTYFHTPQRPYQKNLDVFEYDLSRVDFSPAIQNGLLIGPYSTSRGCPTHCSYCSYAMNRKAPWRSFSAGRTVQLYKELRERYTFTDINPGDANFFVKKDRAIAILEGLKKLGIRPLCLDAHARHLDVSTVKAAHEAGVQIIFLGLETCSPETLQRIRKRRTHEDFVTCLKLTAEHAPGMTIAGTVMMAYPFQTYDELLRDLEDCFDLHEQFPHLSVSFTCILPVMGTPMLKEMHDAGYAYNGVDDLAAVTIGNGFSTVGQWCTYARTDKGKKTLWYATYVINYLLRYPAYGMVDRITQKIFKGIARWRLRTGRFEGMHLDAAILSVGVWCVERLRTKHKLSDVKVGDHGI